MVGLPQAFTSAQNSIRGVNAKIETTLRLPQPCIAPLVFIASPSSAWFAVTGK